MGYYAHGNGGVTLNFYDWGCSLGPAALIGLNLPFLWALVFGAR